MSGLPAVMTLAAGVGPLIVIVTSVVTRRHYAHAGLFDAACTVIAAAALGLWWGLGEASLAVLFAVAADGIAALPTIVKAWRHPDSEHILFYVLVGLGATITLMTISSWSPHAGAFAIYQLSTCAFLSTIIATRRRAHFGLSPTS